MSLKVIELNDAGVRVADDSGIVLLSPGFALSRDKTLLLGEQAEQQARLHPTRSFNRYWHELNLDPIAHNEGIRHHADIAYAHLKHLVEAAGINGEVMFAVPGNFTRQQLAILLGLAKQCPFQTVGVVDSALAAGITVAESYPLVYAELQLHQVLLTKLRVADGNLTIESVVQVPGVGSQNFTDQMMALATNAFVQQCRFNPQHNAESEQQLYNSLPHWWRQSTQVEQGLVLELQVGDKMHTAKLPRESLITSFGNHYTRINQQVAALTADKETRVLLSAGLAALPGLHSKMGANHQLHIVDHDAVSSACLQFHEHIRSPDQGIRLVNALPLNAGRSRQSKPANKQHAANSAPTHVLYQHRALPLGKVLIRNQPTLNGGAPAHVLQLAIAGLPEEPGQILVKDNQVFFDSGNLDYLLNDSPAKGKAQLAIGDRIQFRPNGVALTMIRVD